MLKAGHVKRGMRVLLAGLEEWHASELEAILGDRRARIIAVKTCVEGWKRLHECAFDVLIVDEAADGGGWRDLVAEVAAMGLALPVVLASAKPDERLWVEALSAGAYDVLELPFHPVETRRILLTAAQQRRHAAACARLTQTQAVAISSGNNLQLAVIAVKHTSCTLARNPNSGVGHECSKHLQNASPF